MDGVSSGPESPEGTGDMALISPSPADGSPTAWAPPPREDEWMAIGWAAEGPRKLPGTGLLFAATIVHLVTIPITLMLTKLYLESLVGGSVTWVDFFRAWNLAGLGWLLWLGVILQLIFALFAAAAGNKQRLGGSDLAVAAVVVGVLAIVLSFVVFGGLFGAIGGGLSVGGGLAGRARPPSPWAAPPPPYAPPYPPR